MVGDYVFVGDDIVFLVLVMNCGGLDMNLRYDVGYVIDSDDVIDVNWMFK